MKLPPVTVPIEAQTAALREGAGALALDALGVLSVRGRDRATWLNGMVTNDVRRLAPGGGVYAAVLGLKGKILTDAFVHARDAEELAIVMPRDRFDEVAQHFDRYVVMEDVFVAPRELSVVSVQGPKAQEVAEALGATFPADRLGRGGVDLLVAPDDEAAVGARLAALVANGTLVVVSPEAWEVARIEAGVAAFGVDFDGANFVQEAGITKRAVSFQKGCYLGQEVVCRLEMRGQVQKHLAALVLDGPAPAPGAPVFAEGSDVGRVTSSAASTALPGRSVALAMIRRVVADAEAPVTVGDAMAMITARPVA